MCSATLFAALIASSTVPALAILTINVTEPAVAVIVAPLVYGTYVRISMVSKEILAQSARKLTVPSSITRLRTNWFSDGESVGATNRGNHSNENWLSGQATVKQNDASFSRQFKAWWRRSSRRRRA